MNRIVNTRVLAASPERVWAAHTDPERLARWWGPAGFTSTFHRFDLYTGGVWRFTMIGPAGDRYEMEKALLDVQPPRRLVHRHEQGEHSFTLSMEMDGVPGGTRVRWTMEFDSAGHLDGIRELVTRLNEENLDRLEKLLAG